MVAAPDLSVIVPCRDNLDAVAELLPQLHHASKAIEILVVSGDENARLAALCTAENVRGLTMAEPRGVRLRKAAEAARARHLWFVHADAVLPADAIERVVYAFSQGASGGYFRFRLAGARTLAKRIIEFGVMLRCRLGGIPYGDQAIFVTKEAYEHAGGHDPLPLFDEFRFVRQLSRGGRFRQLDVAVAVDPRRWEQGGYCKNSLKNRCLSIAHALGVSPNTLARWYYD